MRILGLAMLAGACLATSPLSAADLFGTAPPPPDAPVMQQELGSNWYIRGDIGYGQINQATVVPDAGLFPTIGNQPIGDASSPVPVVRGNNQITQNADFSLGFGYRINDWFRAEASWIYSKGPGLGVNRTVFCPEAANAVNNNYYSTDAKGNTTTTTVAVGYQYDYTTCNGVLNVNQYNNTALAMGYADLGHYWVFSPYIGVGGGLNVNTATGTLNFHQTDTGVTYAGPAVTGNAPGSWVTQVATDQKGLPLYGPITRPAVQSGAPQPVGPANWYRSINTTKYTFAMAAAAGLGIQISQSATLDLGYRMMTLDVTNGVKGIRQSLTMGVRYNLN
jgi:opacity protein-like surface antigen